MLHRSDVSDLSCTYFPLDPEKFPPMQKSTTFSFSFASICRADDSLDEIKIRRKCGELRTISTSYYWI